MFDIYKRGQGKYTRIGTVMGVVLIVVIGAYKLSLMFEASTVDWVKHPAFAFGTPTAMIVVFAMLMLWIINRVKTADFLIATEGEMKKVSWSSRREVTGSTKVVILTTFIMAGLLFAVDLLLLVVFTNMGILGSGS
jgi:preprotein translocase subunit SecE